MPEALVMHIFLARISCFLLVMSVVSGCSHQRVSSGTSGVVDSGLLIPMGASRYEMSDREAYFMPDRLSGYTEPVYPTSHLGERLDVQVVCIDLTVDEGGDVISSSVNASEAICTPSEHSSAFQNAALAAVSDWKFFAAQVCTFPEGMEHNDRCDGDGVVVRLLPVKLTYVFEFSLENGGPAVRSMLK